MSATQKKIVFTKLLDKAPAYAGEILLENQVNINQFSLADKIDFLRYLEHYCFVSMLSKFTKQKVQKIFANFVLDNSLKVKQQAIAFLFQQNKPLLAEVCFGLTKQQIIDMDYQSAKYMAKCSINLLDNPMVIATLKDAGKIKNNFEPIKNYFARSAYQIKSIIAASLEKKNPKYLVELILADLNNRIITGTSADKLELCMLGDLVKPHKKVFISGKNLIPEITLLFLKTVALSNNEMAIISVRYLIMLGCPTQKIKAATNNEVALKILEIKNNPAKN